MWETRYIKVFLLSFVAVMFLSSGFVILEDPYNIFGSPKFESINRLKYRYQTYERVNKIYQVRHLQPKTIILGSSVTDVGLKPETVNQFAGRTFNLSFAGGGIQEAQLAFRYAVENAPVKTVILGLETFNFSAVDDRQLRQLEERVRGRTWATAKDIARHSISIDALYDSIYTLYANLAEYPTTHDEAGRYFGYEPGALPNVPREPLDVNLSETAYASFRALCREARERQIDLRMFVSPLHHYFVLKKEQRDAWLERIDSIAGEFGFQVRRFTDAQLQLRSGKAFLDATHFHPDVGDRILDALFADTAEGASRSSWRFERWRPKGGGSLEVAHLLRKTGFHQP